MKWKLEFCRGDVVLLRGMPWYPMYSKLFSLFWGHGILQALNPKPTNDAAAQRCRFGVYVASASCRNPRVL